MGLLERALFARSVYGVEPISIPLWGYWNLSDFGLMPHFDWHFNPTLGLLEPSDSPLFLAEAGRFQSHFGAIGTKDAKYAEALTNYNFNPTLGLLELLFFTPARFSII